MTPAVLVTAFFELFLDFADSGIMFTFEYIKIENLRESTRAFIHCIMLISKRKTAICDWVSPWTNPQNDFIGHIKANQRF